MKRTLSASMVAFALLATLIPLATPVSAAGPTGTCDDPLTRSDIGGQYVGGDDDTDDPEDQPADEGVAVAGPRPNVNETPPTTVPQTTTTTLPEPRCDFIYEMEYPVVGGGAFGSGFGAARQGGIRRHMGVDLMANKLTPVVAVADGVIDRIQTGSDRCCYMAVLHDDGWQSWYIHLNNDTAGTDDGQGVGIRPGLAVGDRVAVGELIGWVGDSGNAETTAPHLHFELHMPGGEPIDPVPSTNAAQLKAPIALESAGPTIAPDEAAAETAADAASEDDELTALAQALTDLSEQAATETEAVTSSKLLAGSDRPDFVGPFADDEGIPGEAAFATLIASGVPVWCDTWGIRVCPDDTVDGATAVRWIATVLGMKGDPRSGVRYPVGQSDPGLSRGSSTCGVSHLCDDGPVTYGEVLAMILGGGEAGPMTPAEAAKRYASEAACSIPAADTVITRAALAAVLVAATSQSAGVCPS